MRTERWFEQLRSDIPDGIVVGAASGSALGVSGPAAGLAVIVLTSIGTLGSRSSHSPTSRT